MHEGFSWQFRLTTSESGRAAYQLHPDLEYLEQFVPVEKRDPTRMENAKAYSDAHHDLMEANRYHGAAVAVWLAQFGTLLFFLTAALVSAWAADYLVRSGRGRFACAFCYAELYLSAMALLIAAVVFAAFLRISLSDDETPPLAWPFAVLLAGVALSTAVAYLGVVRRWHPALRLAGYFVCNGLAVWLALYIGIEGHSVPEPLAPNPAPVRFVSRTEAGVTVHDVRWFEGFRVVLIDDLNGTVQAKRTRRAWQLTVTNESAPAGQRTYVLRLLTTGGKTGSLRIGGPKYDFVNPLPLGSGAVLIVRPDGVEDDS